MKINKADVAELVDARDLKCVPATDPTGVFCKTHPPQTREDAGKPADLQNILQSPRTQWCGEPIPHIGAAKE